MSYLKSLLTKSILLTLLFSLFFNIPAYSVEKPVTGSVCSIENSTYIYKNIKFTCIKRSKKLVWNSGRVVVLQKNVNTLEPILNSSKSIDAENCKLKYNNGYETGFGFPRSPNRLPNKGLIKSIFIFVDFPDAVGTDNPKEVAELYFNKFNEFYKSVSYGNVQFSYQVPNKYFRINKQSSSYSLNGSSNPDGATYFQDALKVADPYVDFSPYDVVYIIPSNTVVEITYGPAFPMGTGNDLLKTDEKVFKSGTFAGTDSRKQINSLEWVWLAHETGHLFGLEHPWFNEINTNGATIVSNKIAIWDLMMNMWKWSDQSNELLGWSRFLLNWINDNEVNCQTLSNNKIELILNPIENKDSKTKLGIIKLNEKQAIVLESRRNLGFDVIPGQYEGVLIYLLDLEKTSNNGAISLISSSQVFSNGLSVGTLKQGDEVNFKNIKIKVVYSNKDIDYIEITNL